METPTIIIGLGTSGLYVLENVQKYCYENTGKNKPANVEYLYLETNENNYPSGTPAGDDIQRVYISLDNMADMIKWVKQKCNQPDWLPSSGTVLTAGLGAGGIRSCGRLALWGNNDKGDNFQTVMEKIDKTYGIFSTSKSKPTVFVTGSLTGGTCSGTFIDFGYLIRHIIEGIKDLYGLFLIPNYAASTKRGNEVINGNTYGSLYDLAFFNKQNHKYIEKWPNLSIKKEYEMPPYELVQIISQDYKDGAPAISNLDGLYKMAGLYLFLNIAGIYNKRRERLVDAKGNSQIGQYGTFGLSAIQFPKDSIQDYIASSLSINLLERLTDAKNFYKNGDQKVPINLANIKNIMPEKIDNIIIDAFKSLNTGGYDLHHELENQIEEIKNANDKIRYIISLFSSDYNDKFYSKVKGNMQVAEKTIVDGIYAMVDNALQNSENLYYAKAVLENIAEYLQVLMDYWKSLGLSSYPNNWDNKLVNEVQKLVDNKYGVLGEKDNVLLDRLKNLLELMKMHLSIKLLVELKNHINGGVIVIEGNEYELPKIQFFNDLITKLRFIIGSDNIVEHKDANRYNFTRRKTNILGEINDKTIPILRVYPSNDFIKECQNGQATFERDNGSVCSLKKLKDIEGFNLLKYFKEKMSGKIYQDIYNDFLKDYRNKINQSKCVKDFDILNHIKLKSENKEECIEYANKANFPFIKLNRTLSTNKNLPRFIVCNDTHKISDIISQFSSDSQFQFADSKDGKLELTDLKNIVVFYDEKGNYNPLRDITYIEEMRKNYEMRPDDLADDNITDLDWNKNRRAYHTKLDVVFDAKGNYDKAKTEQLQKSEAAVAVEEEIDTNNN